MTDLDTCLRAAIYTRVSTGKQVDGFGLDMQKEKCKQMINFKDWIITQIYTDEGISGTKGIDERPGLRELMRDGRMGEFDVVVFYSLDRLGRNTILVLNLVKEFNDMGIKIVSCKENLDTSSPNGRFFVGMLSLICELERDTIVNRLKDGIQQRKKLDGETGGTLPYGYRKSDNKLEIDPDRGEVVEIIFELRGEGITQSKIAECLNRRGFKSSRGKAWSQGMVSKILKNEAIYRGCLRNGNENGVCWPKILQH